MYLNHSHTAIVIDQAQGVGKCQSCYVLIVTNVHCREFLHISLVAEMVVGRVREGVLGFEGARTRRGWTEGGKRPEKG